jgi:hypothetical protein
MNTKMNGKVANGLILSNGTIIHNPRTTGRGHGAALTLSATYHGDRDEFWIVDSQDGVERSRWNCRNILEIQWDT